MPFIALIIGGIMIVAAFQGTHAQLAAALEKDLPGFFKWAAAIAAIMGLGYIPGMERPSRWLLGLVVLVVVLTQYKQIIQGFQNFATQGQQTTQAAATSEQQSATQFAAQQTQASQQVAALGGQTTAGTAANMLAGIGGAAEIAGAFA
jgi:hypothetical protein